MIRKINAKKVILVFVYCIFAFSVNYTINSLEKMKYSEWLKIINMLTVIVLIVQLFIIKTQRYEIFSLSSIFLIFSYIFHMSYQFLMLINYDFESMAYAIPIYRYGKNIFRVASQYSLMSIMMLFLGMIIATHNGENGKKKQKKHIMMRNFNKKLGLLIIIISLPVDLYILVTRLRGMSLNGYIGAIEVSSNPIIPYISYLLLPGVFLYLTSVKMNLRKVRIVAILYVLYKIVGTFTGLRAYVILQIILFVYLYFRCIEKPKAKTIIYGIVVAYLVLSWFIVIRNSRGEGLNIMSLIKVFNSDNNVILNSLSEFGFTINVVCIAVQNKAEHIFGGQILYSILAIVPKVSVLFSKFSDYNIYNALDLSKYGSSYIGDFYFDFGYWGMMACAIYGLFIQKISNYINKSIASKNYYGIALWLPVTVDILFSVRSGTYKLPRVFIWTSTIIILLKCCLKLVWGKNKYHEIKKIC